MYIPIAPLPLFKPDQNDHDGSEYSSWMFPAGDSNGNKNSSSSNIRLTTRDPIVQRLPHRRQFQPVQQPSPAPATPRVPAAAAAAAEAVEMRPVTYTDWSQGETMRNPNSCTTKDLVGGLYKTGLSSAKLSHDGARQFDRRLSSCDVARRAAARQTTDE
jgi:hypothetical protein